MYAKVDGTTTIKIHSAVSSDDRNAKCNKTWGINIENATVSGEENSILQAQSMIGMQSAVGLGG
jgi:hypothetical protein